MENRVNFDRYYLMRYWLKYLLLLTKQPNDTKSRIKEPQYGCENIGSVDTKTPQAVDFIRKYIPHRNRYSLNSPTLKGLYQGFLTRIGGKLIRFGVIRAELSKNTHTKETDMKEEGACEGWRAITVAWPELGDGGITHRNYFAPRCLPRQVIKL
jgi:hypothetical protein